MADRLRVSTRTARSKGYARKNTTPRFTRGWFFMLVNTVIRRMACEILLMQSV